MSHRTKSKQKRKRHQSKMRYQRRFKKKRAALLAAGKIKKGNAPIPKS